MEPLWKELPWPWPHRGCLMTLPLIKMRRQGAQGLWLQNLLIFALMLGLFMSTKSQAQGPPL